MWNPLPGILKQRSIHTRISQVSRNIVPMTEGVLTKKFGDEVQTAYSGNALNRLSFLRDDTAVLHRAFHSPDALFLPFWHFNPLLTQESKLQWLPLSQVSSFVGDPYSKSLNDRASEWNPEIDASGASFAQVVFLGLDTSLKTDSPIHKSYDGAPRFAVDCNIYDHAQSSLRTELERFLDSIENTEDVEFQSIMFGVELSNPMEYSVVAEARMILDWINRTQFCGGCGRRNMSAWGGFKLLCPTSFTKKTKCPTDGKVTNLSFPRTDCCVIVAVVSHDGSKVLIGRGKRFRHKMYSCLAGFLECGESIEDCVRREVFEEAGVQVGRVVMHSSQPWPYPSNIMIGCIAEVADDSPKSHAINLGHDKELLDAKWVSKEDLQLLCKDESDFDFTVPPRTSIAWVLLDIASKLN